MTTIQLEQMTLPEKMVLMEALWDNLSEVPSEYTPPAWHTKILEERKKLQQSGKVGFTDWQIAKQEIRDIVK